METGETYGTHPKPTGTSQLSRDVKGEERGGGEAEEREEGGGGRGTVPEESKSKCCRSLFWSRSRTDDPSKSAA